MLAVKFACTILCCLCAGAQTTSGAGMHACWGAGGHLDEMRNALHFAWMHAAAHVVPDTFSRTMTSIHASGALQIGRL